MSFEFRTFVLRQTDAMGNVTYERTGFTDRNQLDLDVGHAFGPVVVTAGIGELAWIRGQLATGTIPARVSIGASFTGPQPDHRYWYIQSLSIDHKIVLEPHRLALLVGATSGISEARVRDINDMLIRGKELWADAGALLELQLAWWLCISGRASVGGPLYKSADFDVNAGLDVGTNVMFTSRKWDFYVGGSLGDVTRRPATFLSFGFDKRWGL